ncbi:MAG TPA: immunoglobulin domain-containing protein, partial [Bacteroidales bacterium]|nr:immunoglobulin domain-containing protein [Bacteroidales bacterium]
MTNGVWTDRSIWERFDGSVWDQPTPGEGYPAQYTSPSRIDIDTDVSLNTNLTRTSNPRINDLYINSPGSLESGNRNFTVNGQTYIDGTLNDNSTENTVIFYGNINISDIGIWNAAANVSDEIRLYADIINNSNNVSLQRIRIYSDVVLSGTGSIDVTEYFEFNNTYTLTNRLQISVGVGINANNSYATWINEGTLFYGGSSYLLLNSHGTLDASAIGNTVNYSGSGNQLIIRPSGSVYYDLVTSGSGTKTLYRNITVNGDLDIESGTSLQLSVRNLQVNGTTSVYGRILDNSAVGADIFAGTVRIYPGGIWDFSAGDPEPEFRSGLYHSGANFVSGDSRYRFTTNTQELGGTTPITFNCPVTVHTILNNATDVTITGVLDGSGTWNNGSASVLKYENATAPMLSGSFTVNTDPNTVNYSGFADQDIRNAVYYNLITSGGGTKSLIGDTRVDGSLTMTAGDILTGSNILTLNNPSAAALNHTSGIIIGNFERFINQTGTYYNFPVGVTGQLHSFDIRFQDLTSGSLLVNFIEGDPGSNGLPLIDSDGTGIIDRYTTGYWTARARNSLATANYMLNLDASGFGPYSLFPETRIIKRTATGDWTLAGDHADASGSVLRRNGLSDGISDGADGTHYAAGRPGPGISTQPSDQVVCDGENASFTVSAQGAAPLTYKWFKEPAVELSDDGHFSGTNTQV